MGVTGTGKCIQCQSGWYGPNCNKSCSCINGACNNDIGGDGKCRYCNDDYYGIDLIKSVIVLKAYVILAPLLLVHVLLVFLITLFIMDLAMSVRPILPVQVLVPQLYPITQRGWGIYSSLH